MNHGLPQGIDDMPKVPHVFLCHAHEDQARFVKPFAEALLAKQVDVFYAEWDIGPGDRLWERISFGIDRCDAFVLVASPASLGKPWVQEEIGGGLVAKLADGKRFVVVVLDKCEDQLPVLLRGCKYLQVPNPADFSVALAELVNAMHGYTVKPPLGARPAHLPTDLPPAGFSLTAADWRVLSLLCLIVSRRSEDIVPEHDLIAVRKDSGLPDADFADSIDMLGKHGYLGLSKAAGRGSIGNGVRHVRVTPSGFEEYLTESDPDYLNVRQRILALVVNRGSIGTEDLAQAAACSPQLARHVAQWIDVRGLAKVRPSSRGDGHFLIALPTPELRRLVAVEGY